MVEYELDFEGQELVRNIRRWEQDIPNFTQNLLRRFQEKITSLVSQDLKRGVNGIKSGGPGRTGRLANSVFGNVRGYEELEIGAGSNVVYAAIHEFGGTIRAKNKPFLQFQVNGQWVRTKQVEIPAKHYVRKSTETFFRGGDADNIARGFFEREKRRYGFE